VATGRDVATAADNLTGAVQSFRFIAAAPTEPRREAAD